MPASVLRFDTPARVRDLPAGSAFYDDWHRTIDAAPPTEHPRERAGALRRPEHVGRRRSSPGGRIRGPASRDRCSSSTATTGGPRSRRARTAPRRSSTSSGTSSATGDRITRVTFTTETPEYWTRSPRHDPDRVLALYRRARRAAVERADLFPGGRTYDPLNRWNTTDGIVHYVMPINSMGDLLGVSQEAEPTGRALDGYDALPYARATGADARINEDIWAMTRSGPCRGHRRPARPAHRRLGRHRAGAPRTARRSATSGGWSAAGAGAALRVVYEVPATAGYVVGDIRIGGRPIEFGGQLAEHVMVGAHGVVGTVER